MSTVLGNPLPHIITILLVLQRRGLSPAVSEQGAQLVLEFLYTLLKLNVNALARHAWP